MFAVVSGDINPLHLDEEYAKGTIFTGCIAHGMLTAAVISAALATELPGPGAIYLGQSIRFIRPVKAGDEITAQLEVTAMQEQKQILTLSCEVVNQEGKVVASGEAKVLAPTEKIIISRPGLPRFGVVA